MQLSFSVLRRHAIMQGMLSDEVLHKLADSEAHVLDISRSAGLTYDGICRCLQVGQSDTVRGLTSCNTPFVW